MSVPKDVLQRINEYCTRAGKKVKDYPAASIDFLIRNDFDIFDKEVTPSLPVQEQERSVLQELSDVFKGFVLMTQEQLQEQKALPTPEDTASKILAIQNLHEEREKRLVEQSEKEKKELKDEVTDLKIRLRQAQDGFNSLQTSCSDIKDELHKVQEQLNIAKNELRRCGGLFSKADEKVLNSLGLL